MSVPVPYETQVPALQQRAESCREHRRQLYDADHENDTGVSDGFFLLSIQIISSLCVYIYDTTGIGALFLAGGRGDGSPPVLLSFVSKPSSGSLWTLYGFHGRRRWKTPMSNLFLPFLQP